MKIQDIRRIAVVGAGMMGSQIGESYGDNSQNR